MFNKIGVIEHYSIRSKRLSMTAFSDKLALFNVLRISLFESESDQSSFTFII